MAQKNIIKRVISNPLVQTFLIYVSGGWIALEMTDYFINKYGLNERISDILSIILLIGLPIALFLTWYLSSEKEEGEEIPLEELTQGSLTKQKDQSGRIFYSTSRPQIIFSGIIILMAIAITVFFRMRHDTKVRWAREEALPEIELIASDWKNKNNSWIAFELAKEVLRYIPDDPVLDRLFGSISWEVKFYSEPPGAGVYVKPYSDLNADWQYLGETPIERIRIPRGMLKLKIEKENYRNVYDLVLDHFCFISDSLYYLLPEIGSIPDDMELFPNASIDYRLTDELHISGLQHLKRVSMKDFLMDRHEVTNKEYKLFMDSGGYANPDYWKYSFIKDGQLLTLEEALEFFTDKTGHLGPSTWQVGDYPDEQDNYPVAGVSWYEAAAYAEFKEKSLPTIYHWNLAALNWAGHEIVPMSNLNSDDPESTIMEKSMNRFGIYDLAGNVREWCFNRTDPGAKRFILGGGWNDNEYAFNNYYAQVPFDRSETNGFRCINYLGSESNKDSLERIIKVPFRDFLNEPQVSEEIFAMFKNQYLYDKTDLNAIVENSIEEEDYIRERITFDAAYGKERMIAYLYLPKKGTPPYQTVIDFPGGFALKSRSSEPIYVPDMFVKSGRALLYPIYKGCYERGDDNDNIELWPDGTNNFKEYTIMWIKDLMRSIDYLETRNDINIDKLAYFGYSWGGAMGAFMPAVEPRIKTSVLGVAGLYPQDCQPEIDQIHYLPRVTTPVLILNGKYDFYFPYETSQLPFYELLGTPKENKEMYVYEMGHRAPWVEVTKETLAWLDEYLGPVSK
jgi:dienelactone hydrolase